MNGIRHAVIVPQPAPSRPRKSGQNIPKNRCRTTVPERMVETPAELPVIWDMVVCLSHDQAGPRRELQIGRSVASRADSRQRQGHDPAAAGPPRLRSTTGRSRPKLRVLLFLWRLAWCRRACSRRACRRPTCCRRTRSRQLAAAPFVRRWTRFLASLLTPLHAGGLRLSVCWRNGKT